MSVLILLSLLCLLVFIEYYRENSETHLLHKARYHDELLLHYIVSPSESKFWSTILSVIDFQSLPRSRSHILRNCPVKSLLPGRNKQPWEDTWAVFSRNGIFFQLWVRSKFKIHLEKHIWKQNYPLTNCLTLCISNFKLKAHPEENTKQSRIWTCFQTPHMKLKSKNNVTLRARKIFSALLLCFISHDQQHY